MDRSVLLADYIRAHPDEVGRVVTFDPAADRLYHFDLTDGNNSLTAGTFADTQKFSLWINEQLRHNSCRYGIGGYMEHRTIYSRSTHFDTAGEPRRLHLGIDIWGNAGTAVYAPLLGTIHSFNDNDNFGDYGPTIILEHDLNGLTLYTLYGHLDRASLKNLCVGAPVNVNRQIGEFGKMDENGHWPPHLHFQLMFDMEGKQGDYPGVCRYSEKDLYLPNIPDPQMILRFPAAINK